MSERHACVSRAMDPCLLLLLITLLHAYPSHSGLRCVAAAIPVYVFIDHASKHWAQSSASSQMHSTPYMKKLAGFPGTASLQGLLNHCFRFLCMHTAMHV
jgi:hypothetical protein